MTRLTPRLQTLRALFARSGNRCSFPGCTAILVNEKNQFVAQVCHIEAAAVGGERFNPNQTDEERRSPENLILLCYEHHAETDDIAICPAARLREMKYEHENVFGRKIFQIDESLLHAVSFEMEEYWKHVALVHIEQHVAPDLAIEIDASAYYLTLSDRAMALMANLSRIRDYLIKSDKIRIESASAIPGVQAGPNNFEMLYIGFQNTLTKLSLVLEHMELKYLEEFVKLHPEDRGARERLERAKKEFENSATRAGYVD